MSQQYKNNAASVLNGSISAGDVTVTVSAGTAILFPAAGGNSFFYATLIGLDANGNEDNWEIVKVTSTTNDTFTIERAQEFTTAQAWPSGTRFEHRLTAESVKYFTKRNVEELITGYWTFETAPLLKGNVTFNNSAHVNGSIGIGQASGVNSDLVITKTFGQNPSMALDRSSLLWSVTLTDTGLFLSTTSDDHIFKIGAAEIARLRTSGLLVGGDVEANTFITPTNVYALTDVTSSGQTRTIDIANGPLQTLRLNGDWTPTIAVTGPANQSVEVNFFIYGDHAATSPILTNGSNVYGTLQNIAGSTVLLRGVWDGTSLWFIGSVQTTGDARPT